MSNESQAVETPAPETEQEASQLREAVDKNEANRSLAHANLNEARRNIGGFVNGVYATGKEMEAAQRDRDAYKNPTRS